LFNALKKDACCDGAFSSLFGVGMGLVGTQFKETQQSVGGWIGERLD